MAKSLIVGSDHAGLGLKRELSAVAADLGYEVVDLGTDSSDSTDYPDYAHRVASAVARGDGLGLLVCGTGIGMSMAANRHPGVRAALCGDVFSASMSRQHNDANVLCVGARVVGPGLAAAILEAFLSHDFEGGRHERRVEKIEASS
ncbi:MAG: ribose 5-phosphate isomerase B [Deltaproteobacteria bacterium]|nr:ribose 5-phosphate isomerase B [Deltaproteobacteria bacterium]NND30763.1 ribose 5-phosphate isomerase B [Myxococcales bacterium]MBT8482972.1 ribose 5-phosphate isomerase B [Deltaproteobacteria bacterium]NNK07521.1 ribose 5-phosphate isomerase B [Myxococcales bacterium]NNL25831.1 ribose 5-phosphate isomerase B [Myxococcales bacterium]